MDDVISQFERRPVLKSESIPVNQLYRKPTYEEVINYVETEPITIKYPDRLAFFKRI